MRKALGIANGLDRRVTLRAHPQNVSDEISANKFSFKHQWSSKENLFAICLLFIERLEIHKDLDALGRAVGNGDEDSSHLDMFSLEMFENIAYIMAKHADPSIPDSPEEWLDEFSTFSIYQVLPKIIELWGLNVQTDVESKKLHATDRPMTTPLFLLRCVQLGISSRDLDLLTIGIVNDMYAESSNDEYNGYAQIATQMDFDSFWILAK